MNYKIWVTTSVPYLVENVNSTEQAKDEFWKGNCKRLNDEEFAGDIESIEKAETE